MSADLRTSEHLIAFNRERDTRFGHQHPALDRVLHIVHAEWHGIRSATSCLPGLKLLIPHDRRLDGESYRHIHGLIVKFGVQRVCFQGYSETAGDLAQDLKKTFGDDVLLYVVTHVNSSQFEYHFEMHMQEQLIRSFKRGVFRRMGSVKPDFNSVVADYWPHTIINIAPDVPVAWSDCEYDPGAVFVPVENTWRKNLYTNILAGVRTPEVETVYTVNWPSVLETMVDVSKVRPVGYKRGLDLLTTMGSTAAVLAVTMAECQPMTQLEAFAMGTPCLTGPLALEEFAEHPATKLCEVVNLDNPLLVSRALERVLAVRRKNPEEFSELLYDYLDLRVRLGLERYGDFLEL